MTTCSSSSNGGPRAGVGTGVWVDSPTASRNLPTTKGSVSTARAYLLARRESDLRDLLALYELATEMTEAFHWDAVSKGKTATSASG